MKSQPEAVSAFQARLAPLFRSQGLTVKTKVEGSTLSILLEGLDSPNQLAVRQQLQTLLRSHPPLEMEQVLVYGRSQGNSQPAWQAVLTVEIPESQSPAEELAPPVSPIGRAATALPAATRFGIASKGWEALIIGFVVALVLVNVSPLRVLFYGFLVLVHEVGHALFHWLFGEPAVPTVNILYGGGITFALSRLDWLVGLLYAGWAFLIYLCRHYRYLVGVMVGLAILHLICLATPIHEMLTIGMGHGMEAVAIAACLYLSASGRWCNIPGDRAIYGMLGFFTLFSDLTFVWRLGNDLDFREIYFNGIGGVIDSDLVRLATEYFRVDLSAIANGFGLICALAVAIGLGIAWFEPWVTQQMHRLLQIR